uniref:S1 motif domain-containing protein n=1 Tax=Ditylum brightwellii TaxID=49249 RepID=A0A7S2EW30_9STRA|mmetsp:Transcript_9073/g.13499  ORF Transcript_9073/g.13499 Transcript_9073/m.13499 type:complete len:589 (+) Transcript_9073:1-1767(+)
MARKLGDIVTQAMERWNNCHIQGEEEDDEDFDARINAFRRMYPTADINNEDDEDFQWKCNVDIVEDNVAQLFGRSIRGKKEFPDFAVNLKCAIAVARHAKDPLGELTYAWSVASDAGVFGAEMLYLNVHPLQRFLPKPLLLRQYERVLCNAVAEVGVDVNGACTFDHMHGMLTFVPGLGPRKAAALKQGIDRIGGVVPSRKDLLARRLLGPVVFTNSVAFLRIRDIDRLNNQFLFPLDDTRLHPDVYTRNNWAVKIAIDALELESLDLGDDAGDAEDLKARALRDVMQDSRNEVQRLFDATKAEWEGLYGPTFDIAGWNPREDVPAERWWDKFEELDLDTFANMIEQSRLGKWLSHLVMIKWEFRLPYEDPRKPMALFQLLTGETDLTLYPGKEVTGKVFQNGDFGSHIKLLEGDVPGFTPLHNLADGHVESAEDIVKAGDVITANLTEVKNDRMCVDLSLKMEHFRKLPSSWERPKGLPPLGMSMHFVAGVMMLVFFLFVCLFFQGKGKQRQAVKVDSHADIPTCRNSNQARWEYLFRQYCQYKIARSEGGPKDCHMESWERTQRSLIKHSKIKKERLELLQSIDFN